MNVVVKIGGSLLNFPDILQEIVNQIEYLSDYYKVVIIPGGGIFSRIVKKIQDLHNLNNEVTHWMAIKAMEVYGVMLQHLMRNSIICDEIECVKNSSSRIVILQPFKILKEFNELPKSWNITSDSISVYITKLLNYDLAVLVKVVDLYYGSNIVKVSEIDSLKNVVDNYVLYLIRKFKIPVAIVNAFRKNILINLILGVDDLYTIIQPD